MVNAIVRTFFDIYLLQLVPFRREKKSLFTNFNQKIMRKKRTNWTEQKIAVLIQLYPIETTPRTAEVWVCANVL